MELATAVTGQQSNWKVRFFGIWTGQALSIMGSSIATFALIWWVTKATGSATVLATATLVSTLPGVFLGPLAGAVVDRSNRRLVMIVADGAIALLSAWLAYLFWSGAMRPWHVYIIMLARAVGGSFHTPAMQASTSLMVPREHLSRVAGLNQTLQGTVSILGPPLGALLLGLLPLHGIMAIDVVTAAFAIGPLSVLSIPQPPPLAATGLGKPTLLQDMSGGLRYVRAWPGLAMLMGMFTFIYLCSGPAAALNPLLVTRHFRGGALQLGSLESAWGIGVVAGGVVMSAWAGFKRRMVTVLVGVVGLGLSLTLVGLAPASVFWLALVAMAANGISTSVAASPLVAVLQATIEPAMQGRVIALWVSVTSAAVPVSLVVAGPVADAVGVNAWYVFGGIMTALAGLAGFLLRPVLHLEDGHPGK